MSLTETGFKRRTFDEILNDKIAKAKELFGEDIETSELTPLGKYIRINAYDQALTEEEAEQIYYSIFPNTASGTSLDRLCVFAGISRNAATAAKYAVEFTGKAGAIVEAGFLVGTESGITYSVVGAATIQENGAITTVEGDVTLGEHPTLVTVDCTEKGGIGNVLVKEINTIINPSADIDSVIGHSQIALGEDTESDYELRLRFNEAKEGLGSCNEIAIKSALLRVPSVTHAGIEVNEENGSFECYINGGENYHAEIAETIFEKKPLGIKTTGQIAQIYVDSGGNEHIINFSHTTNASVSVRVAIKTSNEFGGEAGKKEIKDNLMTYINNLGIGNPVILSSLYGQIHSVTGVQEVLTLQMAKDGGEWSSNNITVDAYENCVCVEVQILQNDESDFEVVS